MSRFLVTGASGFIGRALVQRLIADQHEVVSLTAADGDISVTATLLRIVNTRFDHVFHLAGKTFVPDSWSAPLSFYATNALGTANVVDFCRLNGCALTFVSAYLYGEPRTLPIAEDSAILPNNPYALSKHLAEQICEFHAMKFGVPTIVIRPFNVYGPQQNGSFLIPSLVQQVLHSEDVCVNDLSPKRDYVHVDDVVDAIVRTNQLRLDYAVYNVGSGTSISVKDVIETIQQAAGSNKTVVCRNDIRKYEIQDVVADISKAKEQLGWVPRVSFRQGIRRLVEEAQKVDASAISRDEMR